MKVVVVLLVLATAVAGQALKEYPVTDFSGGLVNSVANSKMADNQSLVLENFTVDDFGDLRPRQGMTLLYADALAGQGTFGLAVYYGPQGKQLLTLRRDNARYEDSAANNGAAVLTVCDPATATCTTLVLDPMYYPYRSHNLPYNLDFSFVNNNMVLASEKGELLFYDGEKAFPARPYEYGQPRVMALDSGGNLTGTYQYRYAYIDTTGTAYTGQACTSHFSSPSWDVTVKAGKVLVRVAPPIDTTRQDLVMILRKPSGGAWNRIVSFPLHQGDSLEYVDNEATGAGPPGALGVGGNWGETDDGLYQVALTDSVVLPPPGGVRIQLVNAGNSIFDGVGLDSVERAQVAYRIVYIDSAGRSSYASPASMVGLSMQPTVATDTTMHCIIHDIPVPSDGNIAHKVLLRKINATTMWQFGAFNDSLWKQWYVVDTLDPEDTVYTDTRNMPGGFVTPHVAEDCEEYGTNLMLPETLCEDDSLLTFQPSSIAYHGSRIYAVGDPAFPDYLWYGEFVSKSGFNRFLSFPSTQGDWFVKLLSIGNDQMLAFRQNSVVQISGLSFYQYSVDEIVRNVGLTAYRSLAKGAGGIYFAHTTGVRELREKDPLTLPIQKSFDSVGSNLHRVWGGLIDGNYWWSADSATYVFVTTPPVHWECYDFGVRDAVLFDADTSQPDFRSDRYVLLLNNDSIYTWGDAADTADGSELIPAVYQSKYFFEGDGRVRVMYVDLFGSSDCDSLSCDSLELVFYKNLGTGGGVAFDSSKVYPIWTDETRDRVRVDHVCENFSLRIKSFGTSQFTLKGYTIGYIPWDGGRQ